ncbi:hypothetical protein [Haloechinothrix alba]|uniref:hypothetical protein n=1 Tax=Haloechinothrix alba TaxID=664784 RepID=UPI00112FFE0B|nr:hypothetical protein [Haloechinothrix alba]
MEATLSPENSIGCRKYSAHVWLSLHGWIQPVRVLVVGLDELTVQLVRHDRDLVELGRAVPATRRGQRHALTELIDAVAYRATVHVASPAPGPS